MHVFRHFLYQFREALRDCPCVLILRFDFFRRIGRDGEILHSALVLGQHRRY